MTTALILTRDEQPFSAPDLLLLWDADQPPEGHQGRWVSLPDEVRRNRADLRERYVAWVAAMGRTPVRGRSIAERLVVRPGLSYWWMTAPAEYSFDESSLAYAVIRLMAITDVAEREGTTQIISSLPDRAPNVTLADWCQRTGRHFAHAESDPTRRMRPPRGTRIRLGAARRWVRAWRDAIPTMKFQHSRRRDAGSATVLVTDYLAHMVKGPLGPRSGYWASLPDHMRARGARIRWLHLFVPTPTTPTSADAVLLADRLSSGGEPHDVAQAAMHPRVLLGALATYTHICRMRLSFLSRRPRMLIGGLDPWPLLREATRTDFLGQQAMDNALWIRFFDDFLKGRPRLRLGLYLQENQPWEMAFVAAWRRYNHGTLMGVQHTTVRFWDLRYVKEHDTEQQASAPMPVPDVTVLNGEGALRTLSDFAPLGRHVVVAEALRFIEGWSNETSTRGATPRIGPPRLLVVVEYDAGYAAEQARLVRMVCEVAEKRGQALDIAWRPHPASTGPAHRLPSTVLEDRDTPIDELLAAADVALVGDFSSAILRAKALGVSIARLPSARTLGNETDDDNPGAAAVTSPQMLIGLLSEAALRRATAESSSEPLSSVFALDPGMPLWRGLLDAVGLVDEG